MPNVIVVGTCGFPRARAEVFAKMQAVEIQESFYRHLEPATVKRWRRDAPKGFVFAFKASQLITHEPSSPTYRRLDFKIGERDASKYGSFKQTKEVMAAWRRTEEACRVLGAKAVLFQCPPSFNQTEENIANVKRFFERSKTEMIRAWEPRGDWTPEAIEDICRPHGVVHCVDPFAGQPATYGSAYFRLHGKPPGGRNYYYTYGDLELSRLKKMCEGYSEVHVFFNNISMLEDALRFRRLLDVQE